MQQGYYRYPSIHQDTIVFTSEDDLWSVSAGGGVPRRLTAGVGEATHAQLSPDGRWIAYTGREEGNPEVYVMPAEGGQPRRLTYQGAVSFAVGWSPDGTQVLLSSDVKQPFAREFVLFAVDAEGGEPQRLPWGPARHIAYGPNGAIALGRNTGDPARWKRYKGGTAGEIWIDASGSGTFRKLIDRVGNPTTPMWIGDRVYFLADHEGVGNLYSIRPDGSDMRRHTDHETYYARQASTDGRRIVYHAGADLYVYDPAADASRKIEITWHSPAHQARRKFVDAAHFLDGISLHPDGHSVALTSRGKAFALGNWSGAVVQLGEAQGVRHREPAWLHDGERIVAVTDAHGEETVEVFRRDGAEPPLVFKDLDIGRVYELVASPTADQVAIANHRHELLLVDLAGPHVRVLDKSVNGRIAGVSWSPDGRWIAYGFPNTTKTTRIQVADAQSGALHVVTEPVLHDVEPAWDPKGRFLYFLSARVFNPVYDNLHFDLGFPKGVVPCLVTLRKDIPSPFVPTLESPKHEDEDKDDEHDEEKKAPEPIAIDFDGITRRLVAFPIPEGRYFQVLGLESKVLFTVAPPEGALSHHEDDDDEPAAALEVWDFETHKKETLIDHVTAFLVARDAKTMLVQVGERFRALPAGEKPKEDAPDEPGRESGWIDLGRVRVSVDPRAEWQQMYREAWRLQRDQFWTADMSNIDWRRVHETYLPLLDRVNSRSEFSDLMWEMQGELGTSHAYEWGGDYRPAPRYQQGHLGAEYSYDAEARGYRIRAIVQGDPGDPLQDSPLNRVGLNIAIGDVIVAVNGQPVSESVSPQQLLVHQAGVEVQLTIKPQDGSAARVLTVKTLDNEHPARYRAWVENNRRRVHEASNGRLGYVHIPDMMAHGYAEFHRGYLPEARRDGMVVDVRYNGGGHVSQLILEKLARKRLGYDVERWGAIKPFPEDSVAGPLVGLTNEQAGSDGDIFSHCFKLMKLGPLLGKRTWGGVIGIWPRYPLVDGTITTQPEFSFWFTDVGWGVENYGTDPDIEVDNTPQAYAKGEDPQLETAIAKGLELLAQHPPMVPDFSKRPNLAIPKLPAR